MFSQALAPALIAGIFVELTVAQSLGNDAPANGSGSQNGNNGNAAAANAAGASGAQSGLSKTKAIIIGVVVGVIVLLAIIAGVTFFFVKKRRWDRQIERYEVINAYRSSATKSQSRTRRYHELSLRQYRRRPAAPKDSNPETSRVKSSPPVESLLPVYDPATYHRQTTSMDSTRGYGPDQGVSSFNFSRPNISNNRSNSSPIPPPPPPMRSNRYLSSSITKGATGSSSEMTSSSSSGDSETPSPSPPAHESRSRAPRRPKPVLHRLITNL